jgi:beta-galactosidase
VLGLAVEEFLPLREGELVELCPAGSPGEGPEPAALRGEVWAEDVLLRGAEPVWMYGDGPAAGRPAVTCHALGAGRAWYVSTRLAPAALGRVLDRACAGGAVPDRTELPRDVEVVVREGAAHAYLFAINHTASEVKVPLERPGTELLTGERTAGRLAVPPGAVGVVRLDA